MGWAAHWHSRQESAAASTTTAQAATQRAATDVKAQTETARHQAAMEKIARQNAANMAMGKDSAADARTDAAVQKAQALAQSEISKNWAKQPEYMEFIRATDPKQKEAIRQKAMKRVYGDQLTALGISPAYKAELLGGGVTPPGGGGA
jgi:ribosome biogenesis protein Nip4